MNNRVTLLWTMAVLIGFVGWCAFIGGLLTFLYMCIQMEQASISAVLMTPALSAMMAGVMILACSCALLALDKIVYLLNKCRLELQIANTKDVTLP